MGELLYSLAGAALGAVFVYVWQRSLRDQQKQHYEARLSELQITEQKLDSTFRATASRVLEQHASQASGELEQKRQSIRTEVEDLKSQLRDANQKIAEFEKDRTRQYGEISHQLTRLQQQELQLITEANNLRTALTTSGSVKGRWGELVLRNILTAADLTEGIDFEEQVSAAGDEGDCRPDLLVRVPGSEHRLAIDAKASLYEYYLLIDQTTSDEERRKLHEDFAKRIRGRVQELTSKAYQKYVSDSLPYVVMFVPSEAAIRAAFDADPGLLQWGASKRVMIASPATILPLILLIAHARQQFKLSNDATELTKAVGQLGTRLENFVKRLSGVRDGLETAMECWNQAIGKSWFGQQSVVKSFDRVQELGGNLPQLLELDSMQTQLAVVSQPKLQSTSPPEDQTAPSG